MSGSSSVGVGFGSFTGVALVVFVGGSVSVAVVLGFVGVSVSTAFGLVGALRVCSPKTLSGLGVMKSWRAEAQSVIVEPDIPIPAITVRVYELHSTRTSSRVRSTDSRSF